MNEKEKKAIERIKSLLYMFPEFVIPESKEIRILLNLIEKQQKEIKELKKGIKQRVAYTQDLEKDLFENANNYVISKDKIREKIKEYENMRDNTCKRNYDENRIKSLNERILAYKDLLEEE